MMDNTTERTAGREDAGQAVEVFDFRIPRRISHGQMRTLRSLHETFTGSLGAFLTARLQSPVTLNLVGLEQRFAAECTGSLESPACLHVFRMLESGGGGLLVMTPQLALALIARLLGGPAGVEKQRRPITKIEQRILAGVVERTLAELTAAWKGVGGLTFAPDRFESEPEFVQIAPPGEILLTVSLEVVMGEERYPLQFWFPTPALEDVLGRISLRQTAPPRETAGSPAWSATIRERLQAAAVPVRCVLGDSALSLREVLTLAPGDILRTNVSIQDEIQVQIGEKARLRGRPGIANGRVALRITHIESQGQDGV